MKFIELVSSIKIVSLHVPYTNLLLKSCLENEDVENIKDIINFRFSMGD